MAFTGAHGVQDMRDKIEPTVQTSANGALAIIHRLADNAQDHLCRAGYEQVR